MAFKKDRINRDIRAPEVRVIDSDKSQLGILPVERALKLAEEQGLDLVEVSPNTDPPVCRILDYGKFRFAKSKKKIKSPGAKKSKQQLKEVKFRPNIDVGDYQTKLNKALNFLERGDKVKVTVMFRGREIQYVENGMALMKRFEADIELHGSVEQAPKLDGRQMLMVIVPKK